MRIISRTVGEPISLEEARLQCKLDASGSPPTHPDDPLLTLFIKAVREWTEHYLGIQLTPTIVRVALDAFPDSAITITGVPATAISAITYYDADGSPQLVDPSNYVLNLDEIDARILLADGQTWPATKDVASAVQIDVVTGNTIPGDSPDDNPIDTPVKVAMLMLISQIYNNRGDQDFATFSRWADAGQIPIPPVARLLLGPFKRRLGFA